MHALVVQSTLNDPEAAVTFAGASRTAGLRGAGPCGWLLGQACGGQRYVHCRLRVRGSCTGHGRTGHPTARRLGNGRRRRSRRGRRAHLTRLGQNDLGPPSSTCCTRPIGAVPSKPWGCGSSRRPSRRGGSARRSPLAEPKSTTRALSYNPRVLTQVRRPRCLETRKLRLCGVASGYRHPGERRSNQERMRNGQ